MTTYIVNTCLPFAFGGAIMSLEDQMLTDSILIKKYVAREESYSAISIK
jgi:hypothetical protein